VILGQVEFFPAFMYERKILFHLTDRDPGIDDPSLQALTLVFKLPKPLKMLFRILEILIQGLVLVKFLVGFEKLGFQIADLFLQTSRLGNFAPKRFKFPSRRFETALGIQSALKIVPCGLKAFFRLFFRPASSEISSDNRCFGIG
jgi:hypothetical protein